MRLIDADELRRAMYHEAFEKDTDLQKWDNGCWIRYKMFENKIEEAPTIDAVDVVRCKDCINYGMRHCQRDDVFIKVKENDFCSSGVKKNETC